MKIISQNFLEKSKALLLTLFIMMILANHLYSQVPQVGTIYDQIDNRTYLHFKDGALVVPGTQFVQARTARDPSGRNYFLIQSANPYNSAYFVDWNGKLIEINRFSGLIVRGYYQGNIPPNPYVYNRPIMYPGAYVETPNGLIPVPQNIAQPTKPYGNVMVAERSRAESCFNSSLQYGQINKELFAKCMLSNILEDNQLQMLECMQSADSDEERSMCAIKFLGGEKERVVATQLIKCYKENGDNWSNYSLCMAKENLDDDSAQLLACIESQSKAGNISVLNTAMCYGIGKLELNPETQIIAECALSSGGEPYTFAGCAGGRLFARELDKCINNGIGGSEGCFGENNDIIKGLRDIGNILVDDLGPTNEIVKTWNNAVSDLTQGPGKNHEAVKVIRNISNEIGRSPNNVGKAIKKILPKITF